MTDIHDSDLDDYTRFALPLILGRFPEWEPFAVVRARPDGLGNTVEFNVPCPSPAAEMGLWVSTADEELTVGFHTTHDHFTDYEDRCNPGPIHSGLNQAAAYLGDRLGVVSWYVGERLVGTTSCALPHSGPLPRMFVELPVTHATLRSWSGRHDREERVG